MEIITKAARMQVVAGKLRAEERSIGFVPTMGALHEGHISMVREARRMADSVIVSIFVNPTLFLTEKEFENYPRDLARDADLLSPLDVDYIFAPSAEEMYPEGFASFVDVQGLSDKLEGHSRPGYFRSVATALTILFNIVNPKFVFMGQRDAQQTIIVKKLVRELRLAVEIVVMQIAREADGLACASRNIKLSPEERHSATILYRSLQIAEKMYEDGERNPARIIKAMLKEMEKEHVRLDYLAITDTHYLKSLDDLEDVNGLVSVAAYFGSTRLIDNTLLTQKRKDAKTQRIL